MTSEYVKAFIIGSSLPVFGLYFYNVSKYDDIMNYSYKWYTFAAPLFLGLLNVFGLFISNTYKLTRLQRYVMTAVIGATLISIVITVTKAYNYTSKEQWIQHYISLFMLYIFTFVFVVNILDRLIDL